MNKKILREYREMLPDNDLSYLVTDNLQEIAECDWIEQVEGNWEHFCFGHGMFIPPRIWCNHFAKFLKEYLSDCDGCEKAFTIKGKEIKSISITFK